MKYSFNFQFFAFLSMCDSDWTIFTSYFYTWHRYSWAVHSWFGHQLPSFIYDSFCVKLASCVFIWTKQIPNPPLSAFSAGFKSFLSTRIVAVWHCERLACHVRKIKARKKSVDYVSLCSIKCHTDSCGLYGSEVNSRGSPEGLQLESEACLTPGEPCLLAPLPAMQFRKTKWYTRQQDLSGLVFFNKTATLDVSIIHNCFSKNKPKKRIWHINGFKNSLVKLLFVKNHMPVIKLIFTASSLI